MILRSQSIHLLQKPLPLSAVILIMNLGCVAAPSSLITAHKSLGAVAPGHMLLVPSAGATAIFQCSAACCSSNQLVSMAFSKAM